MSEPTPVVWYKLPIIGCPGLECCVPVTPDGRTLDADGDPLPMEQRTTTCGEDGVWYLGNCLLCLRHAREVAILGGDDLDDIEQAWQEAQ